MKSRHQKTDLVSEKKNKTESWSSAITNASESKF